MQDQEYIVQRLLDNFKLGKTFLPGNCDSRGKY